MEKAGMKWELEEEAPKIEDLQVRRCSRSPSKYNFNYVEEGDKKIVDFDCGTDAYLVYAPPESSDHGGLKVSQAELQEEVGPKSSERCVYYQNNEGLWKCRKCCWTYRSERVSSDDIQNSKQQLHKATNFQTVNQQGPCFCDETKGTECTGGQISSGQGSIKHTGQDETHGDRKADVTKGSSDIGPHLSQESKLEHEKQLNHDSLSSSNLLPSKISPEEDNKNYKFSKCKENGSGDTSPLNESNREAIDLDVERVLRVQDTHDLYCPNCKSCVTKRVIIRKRKRKLPYSNEDIKHNKLEEGTGSDPISTSVAITSNPPPSTVDTCLDGSAAPTSDIYDQDQEPETDVFRCLSCFSIFIPAGSGYKLLGMSGDRRDNENSQDHPHTPIVKKSWFSTLLHSHRNVETDDSEVHIPLNSTRQSSKVSAIHESSSHAQTNNGGEPVKTGAEESTEGGTNNLSHRKVSFGTSGGQENLEDQISININKQNGDALGNEAPSHEIYADGEIVQSEITESGEGGNKVLSLLSKRFTENHIHLVGSGESSVSDEITVETCQVEPLAAQRVQDLKDPAQTEDLQYLETRLKINEQSGTSTEGMQGVEVIKSIIYGGLAESITSLGVVSSAAGSHVNTLNVFALGLANLIGGLFIIGHNLSELKNDQKTEASDKSAEKIDQYHELLGQRRNFLFHAVFAIISYLIFGLLPPLVYGFSFQKSDNRDLKLVAVAAVSLVGISILASGKAYVQRAPRSYVKTVVYYVVTALMSSGVSYVAGNLINMLLENFGVFRSSLAVTLPETLEIEPAWASY